MKNSEFQKVQTGWWLTFDEESNNKLKTIIKNLANRYWDGKVFEPHLSVYGYTDMSKEEALDFAHKASSHINEFNVKVQDIGYEEKVSKTLYLEIESNSHLKELNKYFEDKFKMNYEFHPHVTLIYKEDLAFEIREKLVKEIEFPGKLCVDSLSFYQVEEENKSAEVFYKWPKPTKVMFTNQD